MSFPDYLILYFDGACEPWNPGGVGSYGYVIVKPDGNLFTQNKGIAHKGGPASTNNFAEYTALGFGLRNLVCLEWTGTLEIRGDSKLVIEQLNQNWRCNMENLQTLRARCWELLGHLGKWTARWIPREQNTAADKLSQEAWEQFTGRKFPVRRRKVKS